MPESPRKVRRVEGGFTADEYTTAAGIRLSACCTIGIHHNVVMATGEALEVPRRPGLIAFVRDALSGSHRDYTTGNIGRLIVLLAIPMVLEMLMESLFGIVDIYFVARLGADS